MAEIHTWKDAQLKALELLGSDDKKPIVLSSPKVQDGKTFWQVGYLSDDRTIEFLWGSSEFVADNGKLISISSRPDIDVGQHLVDQYE